MIQWLISGNECAIIKESLADIMLEIGFEEVHMSVRIIRGNKAFYHLSQGKIRVWIIYGCGLYVGIYGTLKLAYLWKILSHLSNFPPL